MLCHKGLFTCFFIIDFCSHFGCFCCCGVSLITSSSSILYRNWSIYVVMMRFLQLFLVRAFFHSNPCAEMKISTFNLLSCFVWANVYSIVSNQFVTFFSSYSVQLDLCIIQFLSNNHWGAVFKKSQLKVSVFSSPANTSFYPYFRGTGKMATLSRVFWMLLHIIMYLHNNNNIILCEINFCHS